MTTRDNPDTPDIDYGALKTLPSNPFAQRSTAPPDFVALIGEQFDSGLAGAPETIEQRRHELEEFMSLETSYPLPVAQEYDPAHKLAEPAPPATNQGGMTTTGANPPPIIIYPRTTMKRSPDGVEINGFQLQAGVPQQLCKRFPGRVEAVVYNSGLPDILAANPLWVTDTLDKAEQIADNYDGNVFLNEINGLYVPPLPAAMSQLTSLAGASAVATGTSLNLGVLMPTGTAWMEVIATGAPTAGVVTLEGSVDGVNWYSLGATPAIVAAGSQIVNGVGVYQYLRAAITTAITGGTVTAIVGGVTASQPYRGFEHECEGPLFGVSPLGTYVTVYERFHKSFVMQPRTTPAAHMGFTLDRKEGAS